MASSISGRRFALTALFAWALATALPVAAQDPRLSEAHGAALSWLALTDGGDTAASYAAAGKRFQATMTQEQWASAFATVRAKVGATDRRTLGGSKVLDPGESPDGGVFAMLVFRTGFANRQNSTETVTLERETDGKWRVVGYSMQ